MAYQLTTTAPGESRHNRVNNTKLFVINTHHKLVLLPVDNDSGDLLVHEDQDDRQQGRDDGSKNCPPRVKSHRVDQPASVGVSGLKKNPT